MKRHIGEIVRKKANAGFIGEVLTIKLVDIDLEYGPVEHNCFVCNDNDCVEWINCEVIRDGKPTGQYVYHVSECEMETI
jgi:hypothetical protein